MKTVIIISKCRRVIKLNQRESSFHFNFKGAYLGVLLHKVILKKEDSTLCDDIQKNEEYLIYFKVIKCENGILEGEVIKSKKIAECWDRS